MESEVVGTQSARWPRVEGLLDALGRHPSWLIFLASCAWLGALEGVLKKFALRGVLFQAWSSDDMMQTVPAAVLRETPWRALYYLHIQPPMLDLIRAVFARWVPERHLVDHVDNALYLFNVVVFGLLALRVYQWTRRLSDARCALCVWLLWTAYPGGIFVATLLESTFLSTFFTFSFAYELWRLRRSDGSIGRLTAFGLCIFFTRTIFQWYTFAIVAVLLLLQHAKPRHIAIFLSVSALFVVPYLVKQKLLFGTISTTTFGGYHEAGVVWYRPTDFEIEQTKASLGYRYPEGARAVEGHRRSAMYNNEATAIDNMVYSHLTARHSRLHPEQVAAGLWRSLKQDFRVFWQPTTSYTPNLLIDRLPWKPAFMAVFSDSSYITIMALAGVAWALQWREKLRRLRPEPGQLLQQIGFELSIFGFALFVYATSTLCNRYEWVEAQRLKFILEPMFFVFFGSQLYWAARRVRGVWTAR